MELNREEVERLRESIAKLSELVDRLEKQPSSAPFRCDLTIGDPVYCHAIAKHGVITSLYTDGRWGVTWGDGGFGVLTSESIRRVLPPEPKPAPPPFKVGDRVLSPADGHRGVIDRIDEDRFFHVRRDSGDTYIYLSYMLVLAHDTPKPAPPAFNINDPVRRVARPDIKGVVVGIDSSSVVGGDRPATSYLVRWSLPKPFHIDDVLAIGIGYDESKHPASDLVHDHDA